MARKSNETVGESEYSILFKTLFEYLYNKKSIKMTTISERTGIKYDRLINIKRGSSQGDELLVLKLKKAFPELEKDFALNIGNVPNDIKNNLPKVNEDLIKLKAEVEQLKKENMDMYKILVQLQNQILKDKQ